MNIAWSKPAKILFAVLFVIFIGHELFVNWSSSTYADCGRLRDDKVHFELYRDLDRVVYQTVMNALTAEQLRLGCDIE